jgi:hypothetical protein
MFKGRSCATITAIVIWPLLRRSKEREILQMIIALIVLGAALPAPVSAGAVELPPAEAWRLINDLQSDDVGTRTRARERLIGSKDLSIAPALVELLFFRKVARPEAELILRALFETEVEPKRDSTYQGWFELIGSRVDIVPKQGYLEFKAREYARIDPAFGDFLDPKHPRAIRPEEIIFGGVQKDGIPALRNPRVIAAFEASYLTDDDLVFGVEIAGEARAYPKRIMASHEMANDVIGGKTVLLAYCTLCNSAILYDTTLRDGKTYTFGTSGLLYRSNKLMYDHQTDTLWSQLLGEPVMGPLVGTGIKLDVLPLTQTTWGDWKEQHAATTVLSIDTGHRRDYSGSAYADYFASEALMFPVWNRNGSLQPKALVYAIEIEGRRRAYPLDLLNSSPLLLDEIDEISIVLITTGEQGTVRAYQAHHKQIAAGESGEFFDQDGVPYRMTETALVSSDGAIRLERIPGHLGYWFGLHAQHPDLELYRSTD